MSTLNHALTALFKSTIETLFGLGNWDPLIRPAARAEYGDYQANFALGLAKALQRKPVEIAQAVSEALVAHPLFARLEVSGPGFINITLADSALAEHVQALLGDERVGVAKETARTVVVDYGGANVAKEMHVGHLRSTVIGDAIVRILGFLGHRVIRQNHLGDWGTQFGMLIEHLLTRQQNAASHYVHYSDLNDLYKQAKQCFDSDATFAARARARVVALQSGDSASLALWEQLVAESLQHFQSIYDKLEVLLTVDDARGESFYNPLLPQITRELEDRGIATVSDGALVVFLEGFVDPEGKLVPYLIRKSDGAYLYSTTDLAAAKFRLEKLTAERLIYVIDARQKQHMAMLFATVRKAGWAQAEVPLIHEAFGSVLGADRKPLKTRSGENIKLNELLTEAVRRAAEIAHAKNSQLSPEQLQSIAQTIGIGALKYADLRVDKIKDYVFDWEKMLSFDGNTAPYLQNAYVRIRSLFRKAQMNSQNFVDAGTRILFIAHPLEHQLAVKLLEFADSVESVGENLQLHQLCDYLYQLAGIFHRFYEQCPVLTEPNPMAKTTKLLLSDLTARTLKLGLGLLGIEVLEAM